MSAMASQITSLTIVYSCFYSGADQRKPQSSASLAFVRGFHRWPVNSPHKGPITQKMFPFDDVIMKLADILRKTFRLAISWGKNCFLWLKFYWSLLLRVQLTNQHGLGQWLIGTEQATMKKQSIDRWLVACSVPSHHLNQCWLFGNRTTVKSLI